MKSLKESLGLSRNASIIEGMPKSAIGIISRQEEDKLNNLWTDIIKSEEAFVKLSAEAGKYSLALKEVQSTEEKLLKLLGDSNIGVHSDLIRQLIDEYLSVTVEAKKVSEDTAQTTHEVMGVSPEQYHLLYEHINSYRKKRDAYIGEIERCQVKLDKLKLKGKRTTDVIVEKERNLRQFRDVNLKLMSEGENFHNSRVKFLQSCVQALVHSQINYYGSIAAEYNKYIQMSRGAHHMKEAQYTQAMNLHLDQIRRLTIVDH